MRTARFAEPCEVCGFPKKRGEPLLVWGPPSEDKDLYKKVWVHPICRERLLRGERPPGVEVRGPTPAQLRALVEACENQLGCVPWQRPLDPPRPPAEQRRLRQAEARKLRTKAEQNPDLYTYDNLMRAIHTAQYLRMQIAEPADLCQLVRKIHLGKIRAHVPPPARPPGHEDIF